MASLIPTLSSCLRRMQAGEKRFARRLESHLEDDYLCWYELPVGDRPRYSDFIVLHPARGVLLLEVKDWKLDTIRRIDKVSVDLLTANGLKTVANPLEQVRQCTYQLLRRLGADRQLQIAEGRYQGQLCCPYGFGVVLTHISRRQFDETDLGEVLPAHLVICKDEMRVTADAEVFQKRLWDMFPVQFPQPLTLPQVDRIRWHLFPEIRIDGGLQTDLFSDFEESEEDLAALLPDLVKVMDRQQESLARSMGEGHRVIHGVAGSGKTLILGYRCLYLAKQLHKPILVLCYNITLAARLRELMAGNGVADKVNIYHFHDWCGSQLRSYHVDLPPRSADYVTQLVQTVIAAVEEGHIPRAQYGAVMIDEGHDFEADWLRLVVGMVDPQSDSLLMLYDDAQSIYQHDKALDFSLSSVGIKARGRTTVLKLNYRNTDEILGFAYRFARHYLRAGAAPGADEDDEDHVPLLEPESCGRHGPEPVLIHKDSFEAEVAYIAQTLKKLHSERDVAWGDMCVCYRKGWMGKPLHEAIRQQGVPVHWLMDAKQKRGLAMDDGRIKLMTMHSSKGLEFPLVVIVGLGHVSEDEADTVAEARLLYVAMTRSTDKLLLTCHRRTALLQRLEQAMDEGVLKP